jgi:hypothetical protein
MKKFSFFFLLLLAESCAIVCITGKKNDQKYGKSTCVLYQQ